MTGGGGGGGRALQTPHFKALRGRVEGERI